LHHPIVVVSNVSNKLANVVGSAVVCWSGWRFVRVYKCPSDRL